jgi:hypothetical protein
MMRSWSRSFLVVLAAASSTPAWAGTAPHPVQAERPCSCDARDGVVSLALAAPAAAAGVPDEHAAPAAPAVAPAQTLEAARAADQRERVFLNEIWTLP